MPYTLVRTDSTMINPTHENEYNQLNSPAGEVIMSPRKRYSIISSLCDEIKKNVKPISDITYTSFIVSTKLLQNKSNIINY